MTAHGFLDSAHLEEFKDIQHDYMQTNPYIDLLWSDEFYGLVVIMVSKCPIGKSVDPL